MRDRAIGTAGGGRKTVGAPEAWADGATDRIDQQASDGHQDEKTEQAPTTETEDRNDEGKAHAATPIATAVSTAITSPDSPSAITAGDRRG